MSCSGEGLANVKLKWPCFPSSRIIEQNLIWYIEKLKWKFIPVLIALFPFPYFYSHSHSYSRDIVIIASIPMGIPWDPWDPNCYHSHAYLNCSCIGSKTSATFCLKLAELCIPYFMGRLALGSCTMYIKYDRHVPVKYGMHNSATRCHHCRSCASSFENGLAHTPVWSGSQCGTFYLRTSKPWTTPQTSEAVEISLFVQLLVSMSMSVIDLYSAESWSISTALCVLSGNDEIGSFSAIVWSCCWWAEHWVTETVR